MILTKDKSVCIHYHNIQKVAIKMSKVKKMFLELVQRQLVKDQTHHFKAPPPPPPPLLKG